MQKQHTNEVSQGLPYTSQEFVDRMKVDKESSGKEMITAEEIEGTDFKIVTVNESEYFITWGDYRITPFSRDKEGLIRKVLNKEYDILGYWMAAMIHKWEQYRESKNETDGGNKI